MFKQKINRYGKVNMFENRICSVNYNPTCFVPQIFFKSENGILEFLDPVSLAKQDSTQTNLTEIQRLNQMEKQQNG